MLVRRFLIASSVDFDFDVFHSALKDACQIWYCGVLRRAETLQCLHVLNGKDVFGCFPTGFGISIIYQALLCLSKTFNQAHGSLNSLVIVLSPLNSLRREQIDFLRSMGLQAVQAVTGKDDNAYLNDVKIISGSPEVILGTDG